jgi:hypothetical protein
LSRRSPESSPSQFVHDVAYTLDGLLDCLYDSVDIEMHLTCARRRQFDARLRQRRRATLGLGNEVAAALSGRLLKSEQPSKAIAL